MPIIRKEQHDQLHKVHYLYRQLHLYYYVVQNLQFYIDFCTVNFLNILQKGALFRSSNIVRK